MVVIGLRSPVAPEQMALAMLLQVGFGVGTTRFRR